MTRRRGEPFWILTIFVVGAMLFFGMVINWEVPLFPLPQSTEESEGFEILKCTCSCEDGVAMLDVDHR